MKRLLLLRQRPWRALGVLAIAVVLLIAALRLLPEAPLPPVSTPPPLEEMSVGMDRGRGNLLALQPYMQNADYATKERFLAKTEAYLAHAREKGYLTPKTVVVFPEYYGTWLVAADERRAAYTSPDVDKAMRSIVLSHPFRFAASYLGSRGQDRLKEALFRMKAQTMAAILDETFSRLSRKYRVTIVPGSIVLPDPRVEGGRLRVGGGPLYNVSMLYRPDGGLDPQITRKAFPTPEELPFTQPGKVEDLPVYDTPAGRAVIFVCADCWYPEAYEAAERKGADLALVPAYTTGAMMERPWKGYTPDFPTPQDVLARDKGQITLQSAWMRYALAGRLPRSKVSQGVVSRLQGDFWGMGADGGGLLVSGYSVHQARAVRGASILNLWLSPEPRKAPPRLILPQGAAAVAPAARPAGQSAE